MRWRTRKKALYREDDAAKKRNATRNTTTHSRLSSWLAEVSLIATIIAVGWFLIGYYTKFEVLDTGYQDWMYHAFRVKSFSMYGIASWDHIWGNGVNHWRAYQYVQHMVTYFISHATGLSITHAMLWISTCMFILLRVVLYGALRYLGIHRVHSFFAVIVSYSFAQQWIAMKEYSIYLSFIFIPLYVLLWIAAMREMRFVYVLTAVTGALWSIHPVLGYSMTGMLVLLVLTSHLKRDPLRLIVVAIIYCLSSLPFTMPYVLSGYSFVNPIYVTSQFLNETVISEYFGLNLMYYILIGLSWGVVIYKAHDCPRWARILLVYCTLYLLAIYFGQLGYYPNFINKFQISRAVPLIGFLLVFCFAAFLQTILPRMTSRMTYTVYLVIAVVTMASSIEIASVYTAQPKMIVKDPVALYFEDKDIPQGSVYVKDVSLASYMAKPGIRYISSYNQHLMSNPYPTRFDILMKTDIAYTGVTEQQIQKINDYATVLGIEYIFIPKLSPLVTGLTQERPFAQAGFEKVAEVNAGETFAVLRNRQQIASAYVFDHSDADSIIDTVMLAKPTIQATSYVPWDEAISKMARLIHDGRMQPIPVQFDRTNTLHLNSETAKAYHQPDILLMQSYDAHWKIQGNDGKSGEQNISIEPNNLRFMHLSLPEGFQQSEISLVNSWPRWHWPVQGVGIIMVAITVLAAWYMGRISNTTHEATHRRNPLK